MITILDIALARGAVEDDRGCLSGAEFDRLQLPMFGGCQCCGESLAAYNMFPSRSGYVRCKCCIGTSGFDTTTDFDTFEAEILAAIAAQEREHGDDFEDEEPK